MRERSHEHLAFDTWGWACITGCSAAACSSGDSSSGGSTRTADDVSGAEGRSASKRAEIDAGNASAAGCSRCHARGARQAEKISDSGLPDLGFKPAGALRVSKTVSPGINATRIAVQDSAGAPAPPITCDYRQFYADEITQSRTAVRPSLRQPMRYRALTWICNDPGRSWSPRPAATPPTSPPSPWSMSASPSSLLGEDDSS